MLNTMVASRFAALSNRLDDLHGQSRLELLEEDSAVLLFGLDHELIDPAELAAYLNGNNRNNSICAVRFAARLIPYGEESLWHNQWRSADTIKKEWLAVAAFETLGTDALALGVDAAPVGGNFAELLDFLLEWSGGAVDSGCRHGRGSVAQEHQLNKSKHIEEIDAEAAIVGFSGTGKTSLSRALSKVGVDHLDVDSVATARDTKSVGDLFVKQGAIPARDYIYNRFVEYAASDRIPRFVLFGASTTCIPDARRLLMKTRGTTVHAVASAGSTLSRLRRDSSHPLSPYCQNERTATQIARIKTLRADQYYAADVVVNTDLQPLEAWWSRVSNGAPNDQLQ